MDYILLENVACLKLRGLCKVVSDLASTGFNQVSWINLKACQVGAPHKRARLFVIATRYGVAPLKIKDNYCSNSQWLGQYSLFDICPLVVRDIAKASSEVQLITTNLRKLQKLAPNERTNRARQQLLGNSIVPQQAWFAYSLLSDSASTLNLQKTTNLQKANLSLNGTLYTFTATSVCHNISITIESDPISIIKTKTLLPTPMHTRRCYNYVTDFTCLKTKKNSHFELYNTLIHLTYLQPWLRNNFPTIYSDKKLLGSLLAVNTKFIQYMMGYPSDWFT